MFFLLFCIYFGSFFDASMLFCFFSSSRRRHKRCALVPGVQTCAFPVWSLSMIRHPVRTALLAGLTFLYTAPGWAGGSGMPWETPLQSIVDSVQGPVAKVIGVIIIVITGLTLAFGDTSGGFRRLIDRKSTCLNSSH